MTTLSQFTSTDGVGGAITAGPDGALWFTIDGANKIGRITTSGVITSYPSGSSGPNSIIVGPGGNLWYTSGDQVGYMNPTTHATTQFNVPSPSGPNAPYGLTLGPDGNVWFSQYYTGKIVKVTPTGQFTEYDLPGGRPVELSAGVSNDLFFALSESNQIGRITTSGAITLYNLPGASTQFPGAPAGPRALTLASDNHIWAVANYSYRVVRLNAEPIATPKDYRFGEGSTLVQSASTGLLSDAYDPEGSAVTASAVTQPTHGTLDLAADGSFTYTPQDGFTGTDTFTYQATDGIAPTTPITVTLTVDAAPVSVGETYLAAAGQALVVPVAGGVLANDTDADGDPLAAVLVSNVSNGVLNLAADGSFTYTPGQGFHGVDSFAYKANDGFADGNTVTVTLNVDSLPVAVADAYTTDESTGLVVSRATDGVLANDTDDDAEPLTAILVAGPTNGSLGGGSSSSNVLNSDGTFTYVPTAGFTGTDSFTYKVNDGIADGNTVTVTITINPRPVANNDGYAVLKGGTLTVATASGVQANDTGTGTLTAIAVSQPSHGTLTLNDSGSFTYVPAAGYAGADSFTYKLNDGIADGNTATVSIRVDTIPVAVADNYVAFQNVTLTRDAVQGLLANDVDADGDALTAAVVSQRSHGTLTLNADGSFTYVPAAGYHGPDGFTYKANDGFVDSAPVTVNLAVDAPPVSANDSYVTVRNTGLARLTASGVLANDIDADNDPLTVSVVTQPSHGILVLNPDGSFSYNPAPGYSGPDGFTYKANDGKADGNTATVSIYVDAPPASLADHYVTVKNTGLAKLASVGVLANDTDADGDPLSAILVTTTAHGSLILTASGSFTYSPNTGYTGLDSFAYKANDGTTDGNTVTVTLRVDAPPVAVADSYTAVLDTPLSVAASGGVLANDTDSESDPLTAVVVTNPSHGRLALNVDGSFTYTPDTNYAGPDSFTYKANDGTTDGNTVTVNLFVDTPPSAVADTYAMVRDSSLTVAAARGVLANDTDVDSDPLAAVLVADVSHGTLALGANGSFTYTPNAGFAGTDSFTYKLNDGTTDGNTVTVTLRVDAPPVAVADRYSVVVNTTLTVSVVRGVLANDTDSEGDSLAAVLVANATNGTVTLAGDGSFTYVPSQGFFGTDSFTYKVNDGITDGNAVTVTIRVDAPPAAVADSYAARQQTLLTVAAARGVLANDSDVENDPITVVLVSGPSHGTLALAADGSFTYLPGFQFFGTDSFTYKVNDGIADGNTVTVTLNVAMDLAPVAVDDSGAVATGGQLTVAALVGLLANDSDPDDEPITAVLASSPAHGRLTFNADGSYVYTPDANFSGVDAFTYRAFDGVVTSNLATVTLTVRGANHAPVAMPDHYTMAQGSTLLPLASAGVLANDADTDGNSLTASLVARPAHGTLTLNPDGSFTYTPNPLYFGPDGFTYKANDGSLDSNAVTVSLTITHVNQVPVTVGDSKTVGQAGFTASAPGILANDTDADGDALTALLVSGPSHGTLDFRPDGGYIYIPNSSFGSAGVDSFTYRAFDGALAGNVATVTFTFDGVYQAPVARPHGYIVAEGGTLIVAAASGTLNGASDIWDLPLTASVVTPPTHGTLTFNPDGSFTYTPNPLYHGPDTFQFAANNGHVKGAATTVRLTVTHVNHLPAAANDAFTVAEDSSIRVPASGLLANDTDADGDPLRAVLVAGPSHGALTLKADGSFTYTPATGYSGRDSFTYKVNDGTADGTTATVRLTVTRVNHAPRAVADSYATGEGSPLNVPAATGLLANDTDADGDPLRAVLVAGPSHGALTLKADGSFTYTPATGYSGRDSFTYKVNDGTADGTTVRVALTVNSHNHAPVPVADAYTAVGGTPLSVPAAGILANDKDPDGDALTVSLVTGPSHGILALAADGSFAYTPAPGYVGPDSFTYKADDGKGGHANAIVTLTITAAPAPPKTVAGDYDGDGKADPAVYVPETGSFEIQISNGGPRVSIPFGRVGVGRSIPAPGDYDGDGKTDLAVYMPDYGGFGIRFSSGGPDVLPAFGLAGDGQSLPAPGDYDGDGKTDLAVYLASTRTYAYRPTGGGADVLQPFGVAGVGQTLPSPGDYEGTGRAQVAAYISAYGTFAVRPGGGAADSLTGLGLSGPGRTIPATAVVDLALAELGSGVSATSVAIPNTMAADLIAPTAVRKNGARA